MSMNTTPERETDDGTVADTRCRNCDGFVTPQFARVFGNNRNEVYGCFECMTATEIKKGRANDPDTAERAREDLRR